MRTDKDKAEERARDAARPLFAMERPQDGLPEDIRDHIRLMCDIIALGFQTDKTRVASLLLARDLSALYYPFLGVGKQHHGASHYDTEEDYQKIVHFQVSQLAYLAQRLDAMPEGEGTVLDNSCLLFLSNMWSGTKHDNKKVPVITIGGLGGKLETGRVLDYYESGDDNRKLCSLYLGIMDRMGVELAEFGDAKTRLAVSENTRVARPQKGLYWPMLYFIIWAVAPTQPRLLVHATLVGPGMAVPDPCDRGDRVSSAVRPHHHPMAAAPVRSRSRQMAPRQHRQAHRRIGEESP